MKKIYLAILVFTILLVFGACGTQQEPSSKQQNQDKIAVEVIELKQSNFISEIESTGTFTTDDEAYLSFQTGGIIESILVKESEYVQKGQLLAQLNLTQIKAQYEQASIAFEKSKRDYQRLKNLFHDSVATLEQLQNTGSLMELAKQQLVSADYALKNSSIYAPKSGYILKKMANPGQVVGPGNPVFMVNGAGQHNWLLRVPVSDKHWSKIQIGNVALVDIDALNLKSVSANVLRRSEIADPYTGTFLIDI
jgi:RND family efflux transporter MFP subunit